MREKVIIYLIIKSGVRLGVIGNQDGTDGLRIKDLPDIVIHENKARCVRVTARAVVRAELSNVRHGYSTFYTVSEIYHILAYINNKLAHGKIITEDSVVIVLDYKYNVYISANNKQFLSR